jgi:hypothetical protein
MRTKVPHPVSKSFPLTSGSGRRWLRFAAIRGLTLLHFAVISIFLFGWALPWPEAHVVVVLSAIVVRIGWELFDDLCILTLLEEHLRALDGLPPMHAEGERPNFIAAALSRFLGRSVSPGLASNLTYGILWTAFTLASLRLAFSV